MEGDKKLKEILITGVEPAPAHFTDTTMKMICDVTLARLYHQPLIGNKMRNAFIFIFSGLIVFIFLFYLFGSTGFHLPDWISMYALSMYTCYKVLAFIGLFWFVFIINSYLQNIKFR